MFELMRRNNNNHFDAYNPFREMEEFENAFFGNPWNSFFSNQDLAEFKTDVSDEGDHFLLEADLPGFDKKDIKLDVNNDVLTIKAERHSKVEKKDKKNKFVHVERSYGSYCRDFDVSMIKVDDIMARYENGVLSLELPKKDEAIPESKHLEIE